MNISEKAAYIKGLVEGLELSAESKEVKVINAMVDLLGDLCLRLEELELSHEELAGQVDEIDEDLGMIEEEYYEISDGCDCGCEDDDDDGCGCGHGCSCHGELDNDFDDDSCYFEVTCPTCGDTVELNEAMIDEGFINCPGCGEFLEFDFSEIDAEDEIE